MSYAIKFENRFSINKIIFLIHFPITSFYQIIQLNLQNFRLNLSLYEKKLIHLNSTEFGVPQRVTDFEELSPRKIMPRIRVAHQPKTAIAASAENGHRNHQVFPLTKIKEAVARNITRQLFYPPKTPLHANRTTKCNSYVVILSPANTRPHSPQPMFLHKSMPLWVSNSPTYASFGEYLGMMESFNTIIKKIFSSQTTFHSNQFVILAIFIESEP